MVCAYRRNLDQLLKPILDRQVLSVVQRDEHYFLMRAEEEEMRAAASVNDAAKDCHRRMAQVYREAAINRRPRSLGDCELSGPPLPIS